jgi:hypothetical protein
MAWQAKYSLLGGRGCISSSKGKRERKRRQGTLSTIGNILIAGEAALGKRQVSYAATARGYFL